MEKLQTCTKRKTPFILNLKELLKGKIEAGEALRIRQGKCLMNAYVGESVYCSADLHYLRETVPRQTYQLFFGIVVNRSNMKLLAMRPQYRSSP